MPDVEFRFDSLQGHWPRPRTPAAERRGRGVFQSTYNQTLRRLRAEVGKLDPRGPVRIQADFKPSEIRLDGLIRSNASTPTFPGVIVNVVCNRLGAQRFMCDDCHDWRHNLHAIALTLERLRLVDLYGVTKDAEQYKGFLALPAPGANSEGMKTLDDAMRFVLAHAARGGASG